MKPETTDPYRVAFRGRFENVLRWEQLDALWAVLRADAAADWFIYAIGEPPPQATARESLMLTFLGEINTLLHKEHAEEYCGVVFTDSMTAPTFVKIFDPNNLGVSCGFSDNPPLPGWVLSKLQPVDLQAAVRLPGNRRRWWQRLLGAR